MSGRRNGVETKMTDIHEQVTVMIERDSVSNGDDVLAPHRVSVSVPASSTLSQVLETVRQMGYLPRIQGGCATWIVESDRPLAVMTEQSVTPMFLCPSETAFVSYYSIDGSVPIFFRYWCQVDPDRVFESLQAGRPLPDMFGRD